jgi:ubiquinone/menaquinone biosynthesis C-methylase UbiE
MDAKETLSQGYDRSAATYDLTVGPSFIRSLWGLFPRVRLGPSPAILDVGCGTGIGLIEAARAFAPCGALHGIDIAPNMLEEAWRKIELLGMRATFQVGDAEELPLPVEAYDLVICNAVYHWFSDRAGTLRKLSRALRPGGQIALACVADPGFYEWRLFLNDAFPRLFGADPPWSPDLPTPSDLVAQLRAAGLLIEHLHYEIEPTLVRSTTDFVKSVSAMAPSFFSGVPDADADAVVRALASDLAARYPQGFMCTSGGLQVVARKLAPPSLPARGAGGSGPSRFVGACCDAQVLDEEAWFIDEACDPSGEAVE